MYLQVTCANAWYKIQKSETENVFFKREEMYNYTFLDGRFWHCYTAIIMCNYLTLLRPKQTFRPGTQPTIILIFIDNWKLKSKIKTLIDVKQTCLCVPLTPSSPTDLNWTSYSNTRSRTPTPTLPVVGCNWDREPCSLHCLCRSHFPLNNLDTALIWSV